MLAQSHRFVGQTSIKPTVLPDEIGTQHCLFYVAFAPKFPLKAADFIARGMAEGPALGHVLTLAEDAWLAADFPLEEAALASIADQAAARVGRERKT